MMIAPLQAIGTPILDQIVQTSCQWHQWLLTPLMRPVPSPSVNQATAPREPPAVAPAATALTALADADAPVTDHALLVLLGQFAQHLDLIAGLEAVPIAQKCVDHTPQSKVIAFLVAILAGVDYLQDLNKAAAPLVQDRTVAQAWGQPAFAHYSGISRTLAAADADTVAAMHDVLARVSRPFIDREVQAILQTQPALVVDIDLTGRPVSPTSTSYPDAAFGWMDDGVAKGYQSAISSLSGGPTGRLLLASQRYGGQATSAGCLQAAVQTLEATLGVRPVRRTALVQDQLTPLHAQLVTLQAQVTSAQAAQAQAQTAWDTQQAQPPADPARAQHRQERLDRRLARCTAKTTRLQAKQAALQAREMALMDNLATLLADNACLTEPVRIVLRLDAGFATDANLAWLIERGYTVLTKVHSSHTSRRIQRGIAADEPWTPVGANADALAVGPQRMGDGRYPLEALQVRYWLPDGWRHTTLLWYDEAPPPTPAAWFTSYNGRQTVEAGIKENKAVFTMRRPLVRSAGGMAIQEAFALFAANLLRWAIAWVQQQTRNLPPALAQAIADVKTAVRVLAHCRARRVTTDAGTALVFDANSPFAGAVLIVHGDPVYQTVLPFSAIDATMLWEVP